MPAIELVPVPLYEPLWAYQATYDNLPVIGLIEQIFLVNNAVDLNTTILDQSIGTQGTLANRLAQSINPDGTLITVAIDNALHDISEHLDGNGYVRMTLGERSKLSFIASGATNLEVNVQTISGTIAFANSVLNIAPSDSISWNYDGVNIFPTTTLPASVYHTHYYGYIAVTSDWHNFTVTSINTPYKSGSLRVTINGIRLNQFGYTYVPFGLPTPSWTAMSYTEGVATSGVVAGGNFQLSSAIPTNFQSGTTILVDFDTIYN